MTNLVNTQCQLSYNQRFFTRDSIYLTDDDDEGAPTVRPRWRCQSANRSTPLYKKTTWSGHWP